MATKKAFELVEGDRLDLEGCQYLTQDSENPDTDESVIMWSESEYGVVESVWGGWADGTVPGGGVPVYLSNAPLSAIVVPEDYDFTLAED